MKKHAKGLTAKSRLTALLLVLVLVLGLLGGMTVSAEDEILPAEEAAGEEETETSEDADTTDGDADDATADDEDVTDDASDVDESSEDDDASEDTSDESDNDSDDSDDGAEETEEGESDSEETDDTDSEDSDNTEYDDEEEDNETSETYTVTVNDGTTYSYTSDDIEVDDSAKTITVSQSGDDAGYEIQAAINYINKNYTGTSSTGNVKAQADETEDDDWTIVVNAGTYNRFTVYDYLDGLTIKAADGATVIVNVLDGSASPVKIEKLDGNTGYTDAAGNHGSGYTDKCGVAVRLSDNVTLSGLTFKAVEYISSPWDASAVTINADQDSGAVGDNITIENCTFIGTGGNYGESTYGFFAVGSSWTVKGCTFEDWYSGITFMCDNVAVEEVTVTGNTFKNCDRAIDGYYGNGCVVLNQNSWGEFKFTNNVITGNANNYSKVLLADETTYYTSDGTAICDDYDALGYVTISGNTLNYAEFLLFDIDANQLRSDVIDDNNYGSCAFAVEGSEGTKTVNVTFGFESDEDDAGYWERISVKSYSIVGVEWTDAEIAIIDKAIEDANAAGSHTLTLDFSSIYESTDDMVGSNYVNNWAWTVVRLKYGVRWVSVDVEYIDIDVEKVWDDASDADGLRPDSVTVELYADGEATGKTLTLSESNSWSGTFEDLVKYDYGDYSVDTDDQEITYTVVETAVSGYSTTISGSASAGFTITNTHEVDDDDDDDYDDDDDEITITVTKVWDDDDDEAGLRPDEIEVVLYRNGKATSKTKTLSEDNDWTVKFTGLDADYEWTVEEVEVDGYTSSITSNSKGTKFTITNTLDEEEDEDEDESLSISVTKIWDDGEDADGIRPDGVTVELYANGEATGDTVVLTEYDSWEDVFADLPQYDEDGEEIEYTIAEIAVDGYESVISGNAEDGYIITNTHEVENVPEDTDEDEPADDEPAEEPEEEADEPEEETPTRVSSPQTGSDSTIGLFPCILLAVVAAFICAALVTWMPRRKR